MLVNPEYLVCSNVNLSRLFSSLDALWRCWNRNGTLLSLVYFDVNCKNLLIASVLVWRSFPDTVATSFTILLSFCDVIAPLLAYDMIELMTSSWWIFTNSGLIVTQHTKINLRAISKSTKRFSGTGQISPIPVLRICESPSAGEAVNFCWFISVISLNFLGYLAMASISDPDHTRNQDRSFRLIDRSPSQKLK